MERSDAEGRLGRKTAQLAKPPKAWLGGGQRRAGLARLPFDHSDGEDVFASESLRRGRNPGKYTFGRDTPNMAGVLVDDGDGRLENVGHREVTIANERNISALQRMKGGKNADGKTGVG